MVVGNIIDLNKYINAREAQLIHSFIDGLNSNALKIGEWIYLSDDLKVLLLDKSNFTEGVFEAHKVFKDIHIVIKGVDTIVVSNQAMASETKNYDDQLDYSLYSSQELYRVRLLANSFALIEQNVQHSNVITDNQTLKLVVKIK